MKHLNLILTSLPLLFTLAHPCHAQTVSIITVGEGTRGLIVEAAMKRHLRAEGYTVKGGTTEGFVVVLQVMSFDLPSGHSMGLAGQVIIGHLEWQEVADLLVSEACEREHAFAQGVKDVLGTRMIFINGTMAKGPNEESVAELLSTFANAEIRQATQKLASFMVELGKRAKQFETERASPYR